MEIVEHFLSLGLDINARDRVSASLSAAHPAMSAWAACGPLQVVSFLLGPSGLGPEQGL